MLTCKADDRSPSSVQWRRVTFIGLCQKQPGRQRQRDPKLGYASQRRRTLRPPPRSPLTQHLSHPSVNLVPQRGTDDVVVGLFSSEATACLRVNCHFNSFWPGSRRRLLLGMTPGPWRCPEGTPIRNVTANAARCSIRCSDRADGSCSHPVSADHAPAGIACIDPCSLQAGRDSRAYQGAPITRPLAHTGVLP